METTTPGSRTFSTRIGGVTHGNRQTVIREHCRDGDRVWLRRERWNAHSSFVVGVWVRMRGLVYLGIWRQVGYLPDYCSAEVTDLLARNWKMDAFIQKVLGGDGGHKYGLLIDVELHPPKRPRPKPPKKWDASERKKPRRSRWITLPRISESGFRRLNHAGRFALFRVFPWVWAGWGVCLIAGRPLDFLGASIVGALLWAAYLGVRRVVGQPGR